MVLLQENHGRQEFQLLHPLSLHLRKELMTPQVRQGLKELMEITEHREHQDSKVTPEMLDFQDRPDLPDLLGLRPPQHHPQGHLLRCLRVQM